jgi:hypothetical protein
MSFNDPKVKGSLAVGRGDGFGHLAVGADDLVLTADAAEALGVKWAPFSAAGAGFLFPYGDGGDGNVTLVANTVLAVDDNVKRYDSLTQAGFSLTHDNISNTYILVFVKNTWTPGGGVITGNVWSTGGLGGGSLTPPFSEGGSGGNGLYAAFVFARITVGAGTVSAAGTDGTDGQDASGSGNGSGLGGGAASPGFGLCWGAFAPGVTGGNGGAAVGAAPAAGVGGSAGSGTDAKTKRTFRNSVGLFSISQVGFATLGTDSGLPRTFAAPGAGGGACGQAGTATDGGGGGGGGSGGGYFDAGGAGGNGGAGANNPGGTGAGDGGGGAGGGAAGGFAFFMGDTVPATVTVTADAGDGGDGGDGSVVSATSGGGRGGGGGGGGGVAVGIAPAGSGYIVTAAKGLLGVGGLPGGVNGADGVDGLAMSIPST